MMETKHKPGKAAIYIRESTEEQKDGYSPQAQERALRAYADSHKIVVDDCVFTD